MECTPRIPPSSYESQQDASGGIAGVYTQILTGTVTFNMGVPADVATLLTGVGKPVFFYAAPQLPSPIVPGTNVALPELCAFEVVGWATTLVAGALTYLYDDCGQLELFDELRFVGEQPLARAWLWPSPLNTTDLVQVCGRTMRDNVILGYEGPPIKPLFYFRPGMLPAMSDPALSIRFDFRLFPVATASNGQARITLPTPFCAPPFMPFGTKKGTYLFSEHPDPLKSLPGPQPLPFPRLFRTKAINGDFTPATPPPFDAKIFGGPWRPQAYGVTFGGGDSTSLTMNQLCQDQPEPYNKFQIDTQSGAAAAVTTTKLVEAAEITAESSQNSSVEILAVYP